MNKAALINSIPKMFLNKYIVQLIVAVRIIFVLRISFISQTG